jgi:hypothetical protein
MPGHHQHSSGGDAQPLWRELWLTKAWRLFPLLLIYMSGEPWVEDAVAAAGGGGMTLCHLPKITAFLIQELNPDN